MNSQRLSDHDYFMGLAWMASVRSKQAKSALFVDNNNVLHTTINNKANALLPDDDKFNLDASICLLNTINSLSCSGTLYLTYTPDANTILILLNSLVKKVVYYETEAVNTDIDNLCSNANLIFVKYEGNLNWMKDYIYLLKHSDIF